MPNRATIFLTLLVGSTAAAACFIVGRVIWPAYQKPANRTYDSKLGYAALQRSLGKPFDVTTARAENRTMTFRQLGEGRMTCMPIRVPVIPTDRVVEVTVKEGERVTKGQVLARLDPEIAQLRIASARLQVENAQAELERVKLGSSYELTQERPQREGINLEASRKQIELLRERHESMKTLFTQGGASRLQLLEVEARLTEAERELRASELGLEVSIKGQPQSTAIAENVLKQQQNSLQQRTRDLDDYTIRAPADGVLESVLIHAGEYNRTPGEVGFVIASGLWFEAHVDQTGINKVHVGDKAQLFLEALPGEAIDCTVSRIVPIVTYSAGGPESSLPTRALGMGAPEWPTTFAVIVEPPAESLPRLAPGLTGFVKIEATRQTLAVPRSAVTYVSSKRGFVTLVIDGKPTTRDVRLGDEADGWVAVESGLAPTDAVATKGHEDLLPDDLVRAIAGG